MHSNFTKGLLVGSIIGASVVMMKPDIVKNSTKRRMMKGGRTFFRKSGSIISDVVDLFR